MCTCSNGFTGDGLSNCESELLITAFMNFICLFSHQILMSVLRVHTCVIPQPPVRTQKAAIHVLATVATQATERHAMVI